MNLIKWEECPWCESKEGWGYDAQMCKCGYPSVLEKVKNMIEEIPGAKSEVKKVEYINVATECKMIDRKKVHEKELEIMDKFPEILFNFYTGIEEVGE